MNQKKEQGYYVDDSGTILGRHGGIHKYTVGQRKGLTLAFGKRMYVRKIDYQKNQIVLGDKPFTKFVIANNINLFIDETQFLDDYQYTAKIRYKSKEGKAKVNLIIEDKSKKLQVEFLNDVEASSCGQSLVIYHEDRIVGGGIIEKLVIH